jgi:AcrR family transcriptional regulator
MSAKTSKRPRRKAKQDRSRKTVEVLLEAAARVLKQRGYAAATTNRIAEAAGVSVGTLYEYFADKEEIFDALIQQQIEAIVAMIQSEDVDPAAPLGVTLERVLLLAMSALRQGPDFIRALEQVPGSAFRQRLADARKLVIGFIRQLLEAHEEELRVTDLDLAAFIVVSSAEGIASNASDDLFDERLAREISELLSLYLTGGDAPR